MKLFSYIVTHDTGFAPNPFWGYCTLACCKPTIRRCAHPGDWVVGLSRKLSGNKLIFAMHIDKKTTFSDYWNDPVFNSKRPRYDTARVIDKRGDNIYEPQVNGEFHQLRSIHSLEQKDHDLKGQYVLVAKEFVYYGNQAISLPRYMDFLKVSRGHRSRFSDDELCTFGKYIKTLPRGIQGPPSYKWPANELSWKQNEGIY